MPLESRVEPEPEPPADEGRVYPRLAHAPESLNHLTAGAVLHEAGDVELDWGRFRQAEVLPDEVEEGAEVFAEEIVSGALLGPSLLPGKVVALGYHGVSFRHKKGPP